MTAWKKVVLFSLLCMSFMLPGCHATPATAPGDPADLHPQIHARLTQYYSDFSDLNWDQFVDHFWPGAAITTIWTPPGETQARVDAVSIPDFVARADQGPGSMPIFDEWMTSFDVRVHGSLAMAWVGYEAVFGEEGALQRWTGIDAFTLIEHDDEWRIVSLSFAANR